MTTLEDLYYGNIHPYERYIKKGTNQERLVKLICQNELSGVTEQDAFRDGFILAVRIMVEVMEGL